MDTETSETTLPPDFCEATPGMVRAEYPEFFTWDCIPRPSDHALAAYPPIVKKVVELRNGAVRDPLPPVGRVFNPACPGCTENYAQRGLEIACSHCVANFSARLKSHTTRMVELKAESLNAQMRQEDAARACARAMKYAASDAQYAKDVRDAYRRLMCAHRKQAARLRARVALDSSLVDRLPRV